jgi:hypothetical protein
LVLGVFLSALMLGSLFLWRNSMPRFGNFYSAVGWMFLLPLAAPAFAHTVKVSGEVAATFHIEPHHNPKAGEPARAWFALTQKGGTIIPLAQCDCKLAVHLNPHKEEDAPLLKPALKAIATEKYQGVPGAEIIFPKSGEYELELSGKPKAGAKFQPFELSYTVTTTAGTASTTASPQTEMTHNHDHTEASAAPQKTVPVAPQSEQWLTPFAIAGGILGIGVLGFMIRRLKRRHP